EIILTKHPDGEPHEMLADCDEEGCKIYQIKRVKDGEIFTVGDKVKSIHWEKGNSIVDGFLIKNGRLIILEKGYDSDKSRWLSLECVQKSKQPLFITEDGVDIFEGDEFWFLNKSLN